MTLSVTPIYAGLVTLLFLLLSVRVIRLRRSTHVPLGDGGERSLMRSLRAHGNSAEYAPLAIILMALLELQGLSVWSLHVIGILLLSGRSIHALGVSREPENYRLRTLGMALTFAAVITGALTNLGLSGLASLPVS